MSERKSRVEWGEWVERELAGHKSNFEQHLSVLTEPAPAPAPAPARLGIPFCLPCCVCSGFYACLSVCLSLVLAVTLPVAWVCVCVRLCSQIFDLILHLLCWFAAHFLNVRLKGCNTKCTTKRQGDAQDYLQQQICSSKWSTWEFWVKAKVDVVCWEQLKVFTGWITHGVRLSVLECCELCWITRWLIWNGLASIVCWFE